MDTARALALAALLVLAGCGETQPVYTLPEQKLAFLDLQGKAPSDQMVKSYADMLDRLERKCRENRALLGDYAYATGQEMGLTAYKLMKLWDKAIPDEAQELKCDQVVASILTLSRKS